MNQRAGASSTPARPREWVIAGLLSAVVAMPIAVVVGFALDVGAPFPTVLRRTVFLLFISFALLVFFQPLKRVVLIAVTLFLLAASGVGFIVYSIPNDSPESRADGQESLGRPLAVEETSSQGWSSVSPSMESGEVGLTSAEMLERSKSATADSTLQEPGATAGTDPGRFVPYVLRGGISVDVPATWRILGEPLLLDLETQAESLARQDENLDFGDYTNLIAASAYTDHTTASATMRVALNRGEALTQAEVQLVSSEDLRAVFDDLMKPMLEEQFRQRGRPQDVEWIGAEIERLDDFWASTIEYRRVHSNGQAMLVQILQVPLGDREVRLTLACREDEKTLFLPVLQAIRESLRVDSHSDLDNTHPVTP